MTAVFVAAATAPTAPLAAPDTAGPTRSAFGAAAAAPRVGLCTPALLAPGEDPAVFQALLAALHAELRPVTTTEFLLLERLAVTFWKLARWDRLEAALCPAQPTLTRGSPAARDQSPGRSPEAGAEAAPPPAGPGRPAELVSVAAHLARLERTAQRLLQLLGRRGSPDRRPARVAWATPGARSARFAANEPERPSDPHGSRIGSLADPAGRNVNPTGCPEPARSADRAHGPDRGARTLEHDDHEIARNEPEPPAPMRTHPVGSQPVSAGNEPERPGALEGAVSGTLSAPHPRDVGAVRPPEPRAPAPGPGTAAEAAAPTDPEARLVALARAQPRVALAIVEDLLEEGAFDRLDSFLRALGPATAAVAGLAAASPPARVHPLGERG